MARRRSEEARQIGANIKALRERHHLTQEAAAARIKVAYRTYQSWEEGTAVPRWHNRERVAAAYGVGVEQVNGPPAESDLGQLDRIEAELSRQGDLLDQLLEATRSELESRMAASAKRARLKDPGTPRRADRRGAA